MPTYDQQQKQIERQRRLADALIARSQQPQLQSAGQFMVGPNGLSALSALAGTLGGSYLGHDADVREKQASTAERARLNDALTRMSGGADPMSADPANGMLNSSLGTSPSVSADPQKQAARDFVSGLPIEAQQSVGGQRALQILFPPVDEFTLGKDQVRYRNGKPIAEGPKEDKPLDPVAQARADLKAGRMTQEEYDARVSKLNHINPPPSQTVNVNTEKSLYGAMAEQQGKENVSLYSQARKAPELLQRAQRVKQLLGPNSQAITGAGADWRLAVAKIANQLGFNTGDAAADTEALSRDLAASTLDNIKASGLGAGSGFSNADRDFLEKVVGGKITLEAKTLGHIADLNERSAIATIQNWNATASRLKPEELKTLGMSPIDMPQGTPPPTAKPRLQRNPDGSYTYSP
jgi:hypothetical protein